MLKANKRIEKMKSTDFFCGKVFIIQYFENYLNAVVHKCRKDFPLKNFSLFLLKRKFSVLHSNLLIVYKTALKLFNSTSAWK